MKIYVDADACPVVKIVEKVAREDALPVMLLCDTAHILSSDYSEVKVMDTGKDAVDFALISLCKKEDIVVTQDYGVAAMALGKGAKAIHHSGKWYTNDTIDQMLMERHISSTQRRNHKSRKQGKGLKKRTTEDDDRFEQSFRKLVNYIQ